MKAYHRSPDISRSLLLKLIEGPRAFLDYQSEMFRTTEDKFFDDESEALVIGTGVDMKMTVGEWAFNQTHFHPQLTEKPSDKVMFTMKLVFDNFWDSAETLDLVDDDDLERIMVLAEYRKDQKWGVEAKLKNLRQEGSEYYRGLVQGKGKQLVSGEELALIGQIVDNFNSSPRMMAYLNPPDTDVQVETQVVIHFEHRGYPCKVMLDIEQVDHVKKTARAVDYKTTKEKILDFPKAIRQWHYDLQGAFYSLALKSKYPDYEILEPVMLAESKTEPGNPMDFEICNDVVEVLCHQTSAQLITLEELFNRLDWYNQNGWNTHYLQSRDRAIHLGFEHLMNPGTAYSLRADPVLQEEEEEAETA